MAKETKPSKGGGWIKENPSLAKLVGAGAVVVLLAIVLAVSTMLSDPEKPKRRTTASAPPVTTPPADSTAVSADQPPGTETEDEQEEPEAAESEAAESEAAESEEEGDEENEEAAEEERERPEEIAKWKKVDYFSARGEDDSRLIEAVGHLGARFKDDPQRAPMAARILAQLLKPPKEEEPQKNPQQGPSARSRSTRGGGATKLIEAIVESLAINGSDEARKVLEQLIGGKLPSEDDPGAAAAALVSLAANPCPENEDILFRALTEAEKFRPPDEEEFTAEQLREEVLGLIEAGASGPFRLKLANYLIAEDTPADHREMMGQFLEEDRPENLGAQLILYRGPETAEETKQQFEQYFAGHASRVLARLLGVSEETSGRSTSSGYRRPPTRRAPPRRSSARNRPRPRRTDPKAEEEKPDPDLPYRMARLLWGPECVALVQSRLSELESFEEQESLVLLAGSMPLDDIRADLYEVLRKNWGEGPKQVQSAGLSSAVTDPGLILVFKTLPRAQTMPRVVRKDDRKKFQETKKAWQDFADESVRAWCERFHEQAKEESRPKKPSADEDESPSGLPFALHEGAKIAAEYHAKWPEQVQAKLAGVGLGFLEIHYVRIEEEARYKSRLGHYKRRLKSSAAREVGNADCLESFRTVADTDRKRSITVLISRADKPRGRTSDDDKTANEPEDLIIEILSIETKAPPSARSG